MALILLNEVSMKAAVLKAFGSPLSVETVPDPCSAPAR